MNRAVQEAAVQISNWTAFGKNTLRGFFDLTLASGMIIRGCTLHEKNNERWVGLPAEKFTDEEGKVGWKAIIRFIDRGTADGFRDATLRALDEHLHPLPAANQPAQPKFREQPDKTRPGTPSGSTWNLLGEKRNDHGSIQWQPARFLWGMLLPPEEARMLLSGEAYKRGERFVLEMLTSHRYSAPQLSEEAERKD